MMNYFGAGWAYRTTIQPYLLTEIDTLAILAVNKRQSMRQSDIELQI